MRHKGLLPAVIVGIPAGILAAGAVFFHCYSLIRYPAVFRKKHSYGKYTEAVEAGIRWFLDQKPHKVSIRSRDGLKLTAYYLPAQQPTGKVMLLMHGYRAENLSDFAGMYRFYHEKGYDLLVPSQRSHGDSEGKYICFGVKERYDCRLWVDYLIRTLGPDCRIFLSGVSMGCTTVLLAAGLFLPANVRGIIADCGFTSPYDIFCHVLRRDFHLPRFPLMNLTELLARRAAGFGYRDVSTTEVMKECTVPVLFIHGARDTFVPPQMTLDNYQACAAEKELLIVPQAAHAACCLEDPGLYQSRVGAFLERFV